MQTWFGLGWRPWQAGIDLIWQAFRVVVSRTPRHFSILKLPAKLAVLAFCYGMIRREVEMAGGCGPTWSEAFTGSRLRSWKSQPGFRDISLKLVCRRCPRVPMEVGLPVVLLVGTLDMIAQLGAQGFQLGTQFGHQQLVRNWPFVAGIGATTRHIQSQVVGHAEAPLRIKSDRRDDGHHTIAGTVNEA